MRTNKLLILLIVVLLPLFAQARHFARWYTTMGIFTSDLRDEIAPITSNNFIDLTNSHFYDGLHFHRIVHNFVIQDGDPLGNGYGGPGYTIPDEFSPLLHHDGPGVLAMAHSSLPNSGGSQYYITLAAEPQLDGAYAVFGKVFDGLDVVMNIGQVPVNASNVPLTPVYIDSLRILGVVINNVTPATDSLVTYGVDSPVTFIVEAYDLYGEVNIAWYIDDVLQTGQTDIMLEPSFSTGGTHTVKCVTSDPSMTWTTTWNVNAVSVSAEDPVSLLPQLEFTSIAPNPFSHNTTLTFSQTKRQPVTIKVYDLKGRLVYSELLNHAGLGTNQWQWKNSNASLASGLYLFEVSNGSERYLRKGILLN